MRPNSIYGAICTSAPVLMRGTPWAEELARAPGEHDDRSPSLIIFEGRTGAVQVRCMTGCEPIAIISQIRWHEVAYRLSMTPPPPGERPLDGTATGRVTTKEPPLTGKRVPAVLACIAEWFPQAFVPEKYLPHQPLKIGIHIDLKARCPALSERERSAVLRYYKTGGPLTKRITLIEMAELRESVAHALFETAQNNGRPVHIHEIVAMIEQYESAAARAVS